MSKYNFLNITDIVFDGNTTWCYDFYYDALFRLDMKSGELALETVLPYKTGEHIHARYAKIEYYQNNIIFVPFNSDKILIYNIESKQFQSIGLDVSGFDKKDIYSLFFRSAVYNDYIYLFPMRYESIVRMDLKNFQITYISEWNKNIKKVNDTYFVMPSIAENIVYFPFWMQNIVMKFDLSTGKYDFIEFEDKSFQILYMQYDGHDFFIHATNKPFIIKWNEEENNFRTYADLPEHFHPENNFIYICGNSDYIYLIPSNENIIAKVDKHTGKSEKAGYIQSFPINRNTENIYGLNMYLYKNISNNITVTYSVYGQEFIILDLNTNKIHKLKTELKNIDDINKLKVSLLSKWSKDTILEENDELLLELYLKSINEENKPAETSCENIGQKIWTEISHNLL